jgi:hypothetical protein
MFTELQENIQEEDGGYDEKNQAHEQAVDAGNGATNEDPHDAREWEKAEQDGNQEHHWKQETSTKSESRPLRTRSWRANRKSGSKTAALQNYVPDLNVTSTVLLSFAASVTF